MTGFVHGSHHVGLCVSSIKHSIRKRQFCWSHGNGSSLDCYLLKKEKRRRDSNKFWPNLNIILNPLSGIMDVIWKWNGPHQRASLCSTSLRKPVWNLWSGSKMERIVFFRESGVASSCPTALWKDWKIHIEKQFNTRKDTLQCHY